MIINTQTPETIRSASETLPERDNVLTEIDHLLEARIAPGVFDESALRDVGQNMVTAVQEAAMPYAVTETDHEVVYDQERERRTFMWLGKTAVQTAMSGYRFHQHKNALKRVDVEVAEARHATETLAIGKAQVFISPRMTRADASLEEAQKEHLGDDDAVRVSWLEEGDDGNQRRKLQSLLVRDIPFDAWVRMLKDPANIFGKTIELEDEASALSVMRVFSELEVEKEKLPNGPVTILEEVARYISDEDIRKKVQTDISKYYTDQDELRRKAEFKAEQWLAFDKELAESIATGRPTSVIKAFIASMQHEWDASELRMLQNHWYDENMDYVVTRDLAAVLEKMKRHTLWGGAAVLAGNERVGTQLSSRHYQEIHAQEQQMYSAYQQGVDYRILESNSARLIAQSNIRVGGGCAGVSSRDNSEDPLVSVEQKVADNERTNEETGDNPNTWKWKRGICQVKSCSSRPGQTEVGPCSVCRSCQAKFDKGEDPTKNVVRVERDEESTAGQRLQLFVAAAQESIGRRLVKNTLTNTDSSARDKTDDVSIRQNDQRALAAV